MTTRFSRYAYCQQAIAGNGVVTVPFTAPQSLVLTSITFNVDLISVTDGETLLGVLSARDFTSASQVNTSRDAILAVCVNAIKLAGVGANVFQSTKNLFVPLKYRMVANANVYWGLISTSANGGVLYSVLEWEPI